MGECQNVEEFKVCLRMLTNRLLILHRTALPGAQIIRTYNTPKSQNLVKIFWKLEHIELVSVF